ncbi:MAG: hypothetical protein HRT68_05075 [Flavobacteriaceae bacterium]|nr:hypothetical protein [Flavobacteriaceae bacterium]
MTRKEQLDTNGWIHIKNVFTKEEVATIRENAINTTSHKGDVLSNPKLKSVLINDKVMTILKEALGTDSLIYFGDSTALVGNNDSGFHKDSRDRKKPESNEWHDTHYSLVRIGVYTQDHSNHSGGLVIRDKSHLNQSTKIGEIINVKSEVGDLLVWKLTTSHSGNARVPKWNPKKAYDPKFSKKIPGFLIQKAIEPRAAIFATFGKEDEYSDLYIEYLKSRTYAVQNWLDTDYNENQVEDFSKMNVKVVEFDKSELQQLMNSGNLNDGFKQL